MLRVCGLSKSYGAAPQRTVLRNIHLELNAGEYIAIIGESGSGKSTLLNLIAGLDDADSGNILLDGVDLRTLDDTQRTLLRRRGMGFVFQAFHVLPHLAALANVRLPLDLAGAAPANSAPQALAMLQAVGLGQHALRYPRELSGGELQRVAIARALVHRPRLLLADEPTGNLDAETAASVIVLLAQQVRQHGAAGILVTHSAAAAASADRIYRLDSNGLELQC